MGGTSSKSTVDMLNETAINVSSSVIQNCTGVASQQQSLDYTTAGDFVGGDINQSMTASINMSCVMNSQTQTDIASKVGAQLAQAAEAKGQAVLSGLGSTTSEVATKITNRITANISNQTQQDTLAAIQQKQSVKVNAGGNITLGNVTQAQSATIVATALMQSSAYSSVINELAAHIDQTSSASEANPIAGIIDSAGGALSGIFGALLPYKTIGIVAVAVVIVIIIAAYFMTRKKKPVEAIIAQNAARLNVRPLNRPINVTLPPIH